MKQTVDEIKSYIAANWDKTIKFSKDTDLRIPYTVPGIGKVFSDFYYWDTYFTNLGLLYTDNIRLARNNIDVFRYYVDKYGFIPNASNILNRSQPPLYCRSVYDYYTLTKDESVIRENLPAIINEYSFWQNQRITSCGLNAYGSNAGNEETRQFTDDIRHRLFFLSKDLPDSVFQGRHLLAIAESGWDFNPRFRSESYEYACADFASVDLNCLLYDIELKTALFYEIINDNTQAEKMKANAVRRKEIMDRLMRDEKSGIYYDYNFTTGQKSDMISAASLLVYTVGISQDTQAALKVLSALSGRHGLYACMYRGEGEIFLQWDYPNMWPPIVYFAVSGLNNIGLKREADNLCNKYINMVRNCFKKSGLLWEKYNAVTGDIGTNTEYGTPPMLGWTAGVYLFCLEELENGRNTL